MFCIIVYFIFLIRLRAYICSYVYVYICINIYILQYIAIYNAASLLINRLNHAWKWCHVLHMRHLSDLELKVGSDS